MIPPSQPNPFLDSENLDRDWARATGEPPAEPPDTGADRDGPRTLRGAVAHSGFWNLGGKALTLVALLCATPFTLRLLGPVSYGAWSLIQNAVAYLVVADLGMSSASTKLAGDRYAAGDAAGEAAVVWTSAALTAAATCVAAIALSVAASPLTAQVLRVPPSQSGAPVVAIRLAAAAMVFKSIAGTVNTPQMIRLRWDWVTVAMTAPVVLQVIAAPVVLVVSGGGLVAMSSVLLICALFAVVINGIVAARLQPSMRRPRVARQLVAPLLRYGGALTISALAALPLSNAESFFVALFHGTIPVARYAVALSLANMLIVLSLTATEPLFPALVQLNARQSVADFAHLNSQTLQGLVIVLTPAVMLFALVATPFLAIWAGPDYARASTLPFLVLLVGLWFNALARVPYNVLLARGRTSTIAKIQVGQLIPYLGLAAVLTYFAGAVGAAIAATIKLVVDSLLFFVADASGWHLVRALLPARHARWLAATSFLLLGVVAASSVGSSLLLRASAAGLLGIAYAVVIWTAVLAASERAGIRSLLRELIDRLSPAHRSA